MSGRAELTVGVVLGLGVLFIAFKWRFIGGGGGGANRDKNPVNFWLGVGITGVFTLIAIVILIGTCLSPERFQVN